MSRAESPTGVRDERQPLLTLLTRLVSLAFFHLPTRLPLPVRFQRAWTELLSTTTPAPRGTRVSRIDLGDVPADRIESGGRAGAGSILYFHGGGYLIGSPRVHRGLVARLARSSGAPAYSVDYRLAPEHPFPAAVDDARAAYRALGERDQGPVVLAGDSAGAGLALAVALACRDEEILPPAGIFLICPWVDLAVDRRKGRDRDPILPRALVVRGARLYLQGHDPADPLCSPLHGDLSGLPPILVHAAEDDPLRDDAERVAERAMAAGVSAEIRRFALWHDFHAHAGMLRVAERALTEAGIFIRERLDH